MSDTKLHTVVVQREDQQDTTVKDVQYTTIDVDEGFLYLVGEHFQKAFKLQDVTAFHEDEQSETVTQAVQVERKFRYKKPGDSERIYTVHIDGRITFRFGDTDYESVDFDSVRVLASSPWTTEIPNR